MNRDLDEISARFEIAFRCLESDNFRTEDKLTQIDVFADYLYEHKDNDYIDGHINESSEVFMFISNMIDNSKDCREIIISELEKREDYELLIKVIMPVSPKVENIINNLNIF